MDSDPVDAGVADDPAPELVIPRDAVPDDPTDGVDPLEADAPAADDLPDATDDPEPMSAG